MFVLVFLLALIGVTTIWNWYWRQYYFAETRPDAVYYTQTADGWRLALSYYAPRQRIPGMLPALCCHGLGANSLTFDISSKYSFARNLAASGRDVWVMDLRGHGRSEKARFFSRKKGARWDIDTLVREDVPAAISFVLARSGVKQLHWIGFSMGGILGYIHLGLTDEAPRDDLPKQKIASAVMLGAALDYSQSSSQFRLIKGLRVLGSFIPQVQLAPLIRATIPLAGRFRNPLESFIVWQPNTDPRSFRRLAASGFDVMSTRLLIQLSTLFDVGGIVSNDSPRKTYFECLSRITTPILSIAGSRDVQCPPDAVRRTHKYIGANTKRMVTMGRDSGHGDDFGHADLIFGRQAGKEVIPLISGWLAEHDAAAA